MPITFEVESHNGEHCYTFSTDECGTCSRFIHRGNLSGICEDSIRRGEISAHADRCGQWKIKDRYIECVEKEIRRANVH